MRLLCSSRAGRARANFWRQRARELYRARGVFARRCAQPSFTRLTAFDTSGAEGVPTCATVD